MKMDTVGDFLKLISDTENGDAEILFEMWKEKVPEAKWKECEEAQLTPEIILILRKQISDLFAWRLRGISSEKLYQMTQEAHVAFIIEFDEKAEKLGYIITTKRECVTLSEAARDAGLINVTQDGVHLTRNGIQVAEEIQREINGSSE